MERAGIVAALLLATLLTPFSAQAGDRLLATGGITQVEGSAGGGLVPWAIIAGIGTRDQIGGAAFYTAIDSGDFRLSSYGAALGLYDRVELSLAQQSFTIDDTRGVKIRQDIAGVKFRIAGDAVFAPDQWLPQIAVGLQYKKNRDMAAPRAAGARHDSGTDIYLAATKFYFAGLAGRNVLLDATVRATKANQLGILGFGGDRRDRYQMQLEVSSVVFLNDQFVVGAEYRAKPDNLSAFREDDYADLFAAWFIRRNVALTVAYLRTGEIAGKRNQNGLYLSMQLSH